LRHWPGSGDAIDAVNTNNILEVALTRSERTILDVRGHIVLASDQIVYIETVIRLSDAVQTHFHTELAATDEHVPVVHLRILTVTGDQSIVRINHTTQWVTLKISTMRVEFATAVIFGQSNACIVDKSANLDVGGSCDKLGPINSTSRNLTRTVIILSAISYDAGFFVSDGATRSR